MAALTIPTHSGQVSQSAFEAYWNQVFNADPQLRSLIAAAAKGVAADPWGQSAATKALGDQVDARMAALGYTAPDAHYGRVVGKDGSLQITHGNFAERHPKLLGTLITGAALGGPFVPGLLAGGGGATVGSTAAGPAALPVTGPQAGIAGLQGAATTTTTLGPAALGPGALPVTTARAGLTGLQKAATTTTTLGPKTVATAATAAVPVAKNLVDAKNGAAPAPTDKPTTQVPPVAPPNVPNPNAPAVPDAKLLTNPLYKFLIGAGVSVADAALAANAADKADKTQQSATDRALQLQADALKQQKDIYEEKRGDLAPYRTGGQQAFTTLGALMGLGAQDPTQQTATGDKGGGSADATPADLTKHAADQATHDKMADLNSPLGDNLGANKPGPGQGLVPGTLTPGHFGATYAELGDNLGANKPGPGQGLHEGTVQTPGTLGGAAKGPLGPPPVPDTQSGAGGTHTQVQAPDGTVYMVPNEQLAEAQANGGKVVG